MLQRRGHCSARIAERTALPWHSVDDLTWEPGWIEVPIEEQRRRIGDICAGSRWILDTAYGKWLDIVLATIRGDCRPGLPASGLAPAAAPPHRATSRRSPAVLQRERRVLAYRLLARLDRCLVFPLVRPQTCAHSAVGDVARRAADGPLDEPGGD